MNRVKLTDRKWYIISCCILAIVYLWHIKDVYQISIIGDEYGYWSNAAYLIGLDWSGLNSIIPYYSFGYSFLLIPLLAFVKSAILRYRLAIVLNAVMYIGAYLLSIQVCKSMYKNVEERIIYFACFFSAFYVANLYFTTTTTTENPIYFMYWLLIYTLYCYFEDGKLWKLFFIILETGYMYMIHQRNIGVLIAVAMVIVIQLIKKRNCSMRGIVFSIVAILLILIVCFAIKDNIIDNLYKWDNDTVTGNVNDYQGQISKVQLLFSIEGIKLLVQGYFGKIFYIIASTCGIAVWGMISSVKQLFKKCDYDDNNFSCNLTSVFCILSMLGMVGISAIYMIDARRLDTPVYGRYSEFTIAPMLIWGTVSILQNKNKLRDYFIVLICPILFGYVVLPRLNQCSTFFYLQCTGISFFYDSIRDDLNICACIKVVVLISFVIIVLCKCRWQKIMMLVFGMIVIYWGASANIALQNDHLYWQQYYKEMSYMVEKIEQNSDKPIYLLYDSEFDDWAVCSRGCIIQSYLPESAIMIVTNENEIPQDGEFMVIQESNRDYDKEKYMKLEDRCSLELLLKRY